MSRLRVLILVMSFVLSICAFGAASASAETTLAASWLVGGVEIAHGASFGVDLRGNVLFEDTKLGMAVLCSWVLGGVVSPEGKDEITEVESLSKELIVKELGPGRALTSTNGDCVGIKTCGTPIDVWPENLPWESQLFLAENGEFLDLVTGNTGGSFGVTLLCTVLADIVDTCTSTDSEFKVENELEDAAAPVLSIMRPLLDCTIGGLETGKVETDELTLFELRSGQLLSVSE